MSENLQDTVKKICERNGNDRTKMMDIVNDAQEKLGGITNEAIDIIAQAVKANRVEVDSVVSFYSFLSEKIKGKTIIRLCNDPVDKLKGYCDIVKAVKEELGIGFGKTTPDGNITLEHTPCIGMCDQAPAALINDVVFTNLTPEKAREIVRSLKQDPDPHKIPFEKGDGNNADSLINSMVKNNLLKKGEVVFADSGPQAGLKKALELTPEAIIDTVKESKLRGRGGAGFPTGLKWQFTRGAAGSQKYVLCNADEGEPGTFKDRVILTEKSDLLFDGMTIGGYAIGANTGILYLRAEYKYLKAFLEKKLQDRRSNGLLGKDILGKQGFDFDIRIQMGAGAYVCGEESSLISSCEGLRGDPKTRPPFPAQKGYLASPTTVNNVETFCNVSRILEKGAEWFTSFGTEGSPGTKVLSVSGDCERPGVYEFPFGLIVSELLKEVGAKDVRAVLVAGPSGQFIGEKDFERKICYDDLATGGAIVIFSKERNLLKVARQYMDFFVEESCGYCTPCRTGNVLLKKKLQEILDGKGLKEDLDYLKDLGDSVKFSSRCGLGQTSPNPVLTTLKNFRELYEKAVKEDDSGMKPTFDINEALKAAEEVQGRKSVAHK